MPRGVRLWGDVPGDSAHYGGGMTIRRLVHHARHDPRVVDAVVAASLLVFMTIYIGSKPSTASKPP